MHRPRLTIARSMHLPAIPRRLAATALAVGLVLALAAFALGRALGGSDPVPLRAAPIVRVAPTDRDAPLVVPSRIAIPRRVGR